VEAAEAVALGAPASRAEVEVAQAQAQVVVEQEAPVWEAPVWEAKGLRAKRLGARGVAVMVQDSVAPDSSPRPAEPGGGAAWRIPPGSSQAVLPRAPALAAPSGCAPQTGSEPPS